MDAVRAGYLAMPTGRALGGVVLVHDAGGPSAHTASVADRLAAAGYAVLAPDLYARLGRPDPQDIRSLREKARAIVDGDATADLMAAVSALADRLEPQIPLTLWGFSLGGRLALLTACTRHPDVAALIVCWAGLMYSANYEERTTPNRPTPVVDVLDGLSVPLLLIGAEMDIDPKPPVIADIRDRLIAAGKDVIAHVYPGVGHAFFDEGTRNYSAPAAEQLWEEVIGFLHRHLAGPRSPLRPR